MTITDDARQRRSRLLLLDIEEKFDLSKFAGNEESSISNLKSLLLPLFLVVSVFKMHIDTQGKIVGGMSEDGGSAARSRRVSIGFLDRS